MSLHKTTVEYWCNERYQYAYSNGPPVLRWHCSCGRLGPGVPFIGAASAVTPNAVEYRKAERGGRMHVAAEERRR